MSGTGAYLNPRRVRVVLFDAVGTLLFADPPVADIYHSLGRRHGSGLSREKIAVRFSAALEGCRDVHDTDEQRELQRWRSIVQGIFDDLPDNGELFQDLWDYFASPAAWRTFDDVEAAWSDLECRGLTVGIASNFDARLVRICRAISPLDRASHVFYSSGIGCAKPRRLFFEQIQRQLNVDPAEILLVGDDPIADVGGAAAAGWQSLLLDRQQTASGAPRINSLMRLLERME